MMMRDVDAEVALAGVAGDAAWQEYRVISREQRAEALRAAARALRAGQGHLVSLAIEETGLSEPRLLGEVERTAAQAELFAVVVEDGTYLDAAIDHGGGGMPDIRRMRVPVGPVAVFAAGNFPFAFGVFGGDTVSALAAGCTVVVKTHPGYPRLSRETARIVTSALTSAGLPADVLQLVPDPYAGVPLVQNEHIRAVGFTGSVSGGRALFDVAAARETPIPFFAEMSSINPLIITAKAAGVRVVERTRQIATAITGSAGQLCTKPGLVFVPRDAAAFVENLAEALRRSSPQRMLSDDIRRRYEQQLDVWSASGARVVVSPGDGTEKIGATLMAIEVTALAPEHMEEAFGPAAILVEYERLADVQGVLKRAGGQLTTTLHFEEGEAEALRPLVEDAARNSGRVLFDGVPTGVRVAWAMTHGGPYPATTAAGTTSVGASAIDRWLRPVTWQTCPAEFLPDELRDAPVAPIRRRVDGEWTAVAG